MVIDGRRYVRQQRGACCYHTLAGPVVVRRESIRLVGMHNGPTVVPLEVRAGLRERSTPALAFSITQGFAERPLRHYELEMRAAYRHTPSRSTLERIGKRVSAALETMVTDAEPAIRNAEPGVPKVGSLSVGLDRTSVTMAEVTGPVALHAARIRRTARRSCRT